MHNLAVSSADIFKLWLYFYYSPSVSRHCEHWGIPGKQLRPARARRQALAAHPILPQVRAVQPEAWDSSSSGHNAPLWGWFEAGVGCQPMCVAQDQAQ